jgi:ABC-type uncharacterized transport system auxiliary subunit
MQTNKKVAALVAMVVVMLALASCGKAAEPTTVTSTGTTDAMTSTAATDTTASQAN